MRQLKMKKNRINIVIVLLAMCIFCYCSEKQNKFNTHTVYGNLEINSKSDLKPLIINLDSIVFVGLETTYMGFLRIFNDTIYYIDTHKPEIFVITPEGKVHDRRFRQGKGPKEFLADIIADFHLFDAGGGLLQGLSWDIHNFDNNWNISSPFKRIDWGVTPQEREKNRLNPNPSLPASYDLVLSPDIDRPRISGDYIYYQVYGGLPGFSVYDSRLYYQEGRIVVRINHQTAEVKDVIGLRPPIYDNFEYLYAGSFVIFDTKPKEDKFFLSFNIDSLIYVCDNDLKPLHAFGRAGRDMDTNYQSIKGEDFEELFPLVEFERKTRGYYTWLEYIPERNLLFRAYQKGSHSKTDGLQIYKDQVLIADVDVPKGFRVEGYIEPYFISNQFEHPYEERIVIYKFKLNL